MVSGNELFSLLLYLPSVAASVCKGAEALKLDRFLGTAILKFFFTHP